MREESLDCKSITQKEFADILEREYASGVRAVKMHINDYARIRELGEKEIELNQNESELRQGRSGVIRGVMILIRPVKGKIKMEEGVVRYYTESEYEAYLEGVEMFMS